MAERKENNESFDATEYIKRYAHKELPSEKVSNGVKDIKKALNFLKGVFALNHIKIDTDDLISLAIKESHLNNNSVSISGATGYFQLKDQAITDAKIKLKSLGVNSDKLNKKNPVDNAILGIAYTLVIKGYVKEKLPNINYPQEFNLFAYNGGAGNLKAIVDEYFKENPGNEGEEKNISWEKLVKYLVGKVTGKNMDEINPNNGSSQEFNISYKDWFNGVDFSKNTEILTFSGYTLTKGKIYEMINYVEKIKAIKETNQNYKIPGSTEKTANFRKEVVKAGSVGDRKRLSNELPKLHNKKTTKKK